MIVWDADDFGANHVISDMCQSHDCRDQLDKFHLANPNFKATLFAIPFQMTPELAMWCKINESWIELAIHGFYHSSNYECEKITYEQMQQYMELVYRMWPTSFVKGFKAPGWQISDDAYKWLKDNGFWVADQSYNDERRPKDLPAYIVMGNEGKVLYDNRESDIMVASHHHTWNCMGNGVYEQEEYIINLIKDESDFRFISEIVDENTTH